MRIKTILTHHVGPFSDQHFSFDNDWTGKPETKVLLTGPNGCGKSTLLRAVAVLWDACAYWLDHQKPLPQKHESRVWLQRWGGLVVILDGIHPFFDQPVGLIFGERIWIESVMHKFPDTVWFGETINRPLQGRTSRIFRMLHLPQDDWFFKWVDARKKLILTYEPVNAPNVIYLDAEERRWVTPKKYISEPVLDQLSQRWLTKYMVTEDWRTQLEPSLITLKTSSLHRFHEIVRSMNQFLSGKQIDPDIKNGESRLRVKLEGRGAASHLLDDLSAGEHQVLILIYLISRFLQPEGIVLIDEPDLYLHPSLISPLLSTLEQLVQSRDGQFVITSHSVDVWSRYEQSGMRIELDSKPVTPAGRFAERKDKHEAMA
ncbi:MAG: AAA family ATPase [Candidatus Cloacimonetes bacterium]|nr:AAA family ATPase [Candidatus Cloacimonadota bacterium]